MKMRVICILLAIYSVGTLALGDFWYGVNLGFKDITVARIGPEDEILPITKIEGSEEYKAHMKQLSINSSRRRDGEPGIRSFCPTEEIEEMYHPDETYEVSCYVPEGPQEIFNNTLSQVLDVSARLGHPMNISSITFPSTIDTFEWDYLYRIFLNSPLAADVKKLWQVLRARRATQVAYDLHRLSGDRVIKTHEYPQFSEWADWSSMMFIDYGTDSLNFTVAEIDGGVTEVMPGVGGWFTWGQSEGMQENIVRGALQEFLFKFSRNKLAEGLVDIVVQGEASPEAMKSLGSQLRQILPEKWKGLVRDQIDPNFVAAAGGAFNARWMAAVMAQPGCTCCDPGFTLDENNKIVIGNDEHVEL